jgi:hypothetical protein
MLRGLYVVESLLLGRALDRRRCEHGCGYHEDGQQYQ